MLKYQVVGDARMVIWLQLPIPQTMLYFCMVNWLQLPIPKQKHAHEHSMQDNLSGA